MMTTDQPSCPEHNSGKFPCCFFISYIEPKTASQYSETPECGSWTRICALIMASIRPPSKNDPTTNHVNVKAEVQVAFMNFSQQVE